MLAIRLMADTDPSMINGSCRNASGPGRHDPDLYSIHTVVYKAESAHAWRDYASKPIPPLTAPVDRSGSSTGVVPCLPWNSTALACMHMMRKEKQYYY